MEMEQISLRDHLAALADAHKGVHEQEALARIEAAKRIDTRLEQLNELRSEVLTDRNSLVRIDAHTAAVEALKAQMASEVRTLKSELTSELNALKALIDATNVTVEGHGKQINQWTGHGQGLSMSMRVLVGVAGFALTLVTIYFAISGS